MVAPFNYNVQGANVDPFGAFTQAYGQGAAIRADQARAQAAEVAAQEKMMLQQAMREFGTAKTPAEKVAVMEKYPSFAKPISEQWGAFDEATRKPVYDAGLRGYTALQGGNGKAAAQEWRTTSEAFKNSGKPDIAKQFADMADIAEKDPNAANIMASAFLAGTDGKRFKEYGEAVGTQGLTSFQKDLAASGVDPKSPEGVALAKQYVQNRVDPIVTMETPRGTQFIGPMSEYQRRYGGGGGAAPQKLPVVTNQQQYDAIPSGQKFVWNGAVMEKP